MTLCILQGYDGRRSRGTILRCAEPLVPKVEELGVILYVLHILALEDEELWAWAGGIGVFPLDEGPPSRADGGGGKRKDVWWVVRVVAL